MSKRLNIDYVKKFIEDETNGEYICLSNVYKNNKEKIEVLHKKCNNSYFVRFNDFQQGYRCKECSNNEANENKRLKNIEEFKIKLKELEGNNYEVISKTYKKGRIKIRHNKCGNEYWIKPSDFIRGNRCLNCSGYKKKSNEEFKQEVKELGNNQYIILEDYINNSTPILFKCLNCGREWKMTPHNFLNGTRCTCQLRNHSSKFEREIIKYIKSFYNGEIIQNSRDIISPKELDLYVPELNLAIECDGLYYHSEESLKSRGIHYTTYHLEKTKLCEEKGIKLIHIFESEWYNKNSLVKDKIKYIMKCSNKKRIHSKNKKCYIKEISYDKKKSFLDKNHIQGNDVNSVINLGLFGKSPKNGKNILLSVMTFAKPRFGRNNEEKYDYELSRFASNINYVVLDAFSTLFEYFQDNYEFNKIITYADRRWSDGKVYMKNGWHHIHNSEPTYWYFNQNKNSYILENRIKYQKHKLKKLFPDIYDEQKSEKQIMYEAGYQRIYDCGNMVFEYNKGIR